MSEKMPLKRFILAQVPIYTQDKTFPVTFAQ